MMSKNSTLLFTVEQWELTRRLKNSGLTKEQLCQAFDDLDKMEKDLGSLYNIPLSNNNGATSSSSASASTKNIPNPHKNNQKPASNGFNNNSTNTNSLNNSSTDTITSASAASNIVNTYFASVIDPEVENKEVEDFRR